MNVMVAVTTMTIELYSHQEKAMNELESGFILCGGVGSGKSRTAIAYYFVKECKGQLSDYPKMETPKDLYIITTARKRDTLEWEGECAPFLLSTNKEVNYHDVNVVVDSWNNISKYTNVENAFFIFDEQRVVGSGLWVKSFLEITNSNTWLLLTATPGDTWMDYAPVFIANGFYKNKTEFLRRHVVFSRFAKYPKVDRYIECGRLERIKKQIMVYMEYKKHTTPHDEEVFADFNKEIYDRVFLKRWNVFENKPVKDVSELCYLMRRIVNSDPSRIRIIKSLLEKHPKLVIFYNFNYELQMLRDLGAELNISFAEWNGHKHEPIPNSNTWIYVVQYTAGAEGWNCIETNCIVFYSQTYSYKAMVQAAGRIDRLNTTFSDLYYYHIKSKSIIDLAISRALVNKKSFNEKELGL